MNEEPELKRLEPYTDFWACEDPEDPAIVAWECEHGDTYAYACNLADAVATMNALKQPYWYRAVSTDDGHGGIQVTHFLEAAGK